MCSLQRIMHADNGTALRCHTMHGIILDWYNKDRLATVKRRDFRRAEKKIFSGNTVILIILGVLVSPWRGIKIRSGKFLEELKV